MVRSLGREIRPADATADVAPPVARAKVERQLRRDCREARIDGHVDRSCLGAGVLGVVASRLADFRTQSKRHDSKSKRIKVRAEDKTESACRQVIGGHAKCARDGRVLFELWKM